MGIAKYLALRSVCRWPNVSLVWEMSFTLFVADMVMCGSPAAADCFLMGLLTSHLHCQCWLRPSGAWCFSPQYLLVPVWTQWIIQQSGKFGRNIIKSFSSRDRRAAGRTAALQPHPHLTPTYHHTIDRSPPQDTVPPSPRAPPLELCSVLNARVWIAMSSWTGCNLPAAQLLSGHQDSLRPLCHDNFIHRPRYHHLAAAPVTTLPPDNGLNTPGSQAQFSHHPTINYLSTKSAKFVAQTETF